MTQIVPEQEQINENQLKKDKQPKKPSSFLSWVWFLIVLASVFLFFKYIIGVTVISGSSMVPTLTNNNVIMTSNMFYTPERNDIVVYENGQGNHIIKRVIALPNDTVEIKNGDVIVNGERLNEPYTAGNSSDMDEITIDDQSYFLVGDNREPGESLDSRDRDIGPISEDQLTGKAMFSLYPLRFSFD